MNWLDVFKFDENGEAHKILQISSEESEEHTNSVFEALIGNSVELPQADYHIDLVSRTEGIINEVFVTADAFNNLFNSTN